MERGILSVIVPVYQAAAYLERCVASLAGQSYEKLEILLIDDGSTDGSAELCERWSERDGRIRAAHQANAGGAAARNRGLELCRGEYVTFADADDWLEADAYARALAAMEEAGADGVYFGWFEDREDGTSVPAPLRCPLRTGDASDARLWMLRTRSGYRGYMCNKVYRRAALEREGGLCRGAEGMQSAEDLLWNLEAAGGCGRVAFLPEPLYHYCRRGDSASHASRWLRLAGTVCTQREESLARLAGERPDVYAAALYSYHWMLLGLMRSCWLSGENEAGREYLRREREDARSAYEAAAPLAERLHGRWLECCVRRGWGAEVFLPLFRLLNGIDCFFYQRSGRAC